MRAELNDQNNEQNYVARKLKSVRSKMYQSYLIPFGVDFSLRMSVVALASLVGKNAVWISIIILTAFRIKAVKDLADMAKGLVESERLHNPTLTVKKMFKRDFKALRHSVSSLIKFRNKVKLHKESQIAKSQTNSLIMIAGAVFPMLFDYISMGIAATYGAVGAIITQGIDTGLHLGSLIILFSNVRKINEKLHKFNTEYYDNFKLFVRENLPSEKGLFSKIRNRLKVRVILNTQNTCQNPEKIRRFLISPEHQSWAIEHAIDMEYWELFYWKFPDEHDKSEVSIRKCGHRYMIVTKIDEPVSSNKKGRFGSFRDTYTVEITEDKYRELLDFFYKDNSIIYKHKRYMILMESDEIRISLDVYSNDEHNGLSIASIKFANAEEADAFAIPQWFGKEITIDPDYTGRHFPPYEAESVQV